MFECRSKHINKSLGGKRSPDFSNRKNDKTMILLEIFQNCFIVGYDGKKIPFVKDYFLFSDTGERYILTNKENSEQVSLPKQSTIVIKRNIFHEGID
jgi:hypothetical protein